MNKRSRIDRIMDKRDGMETWIPSEIQSLNGDNIDKMGMQ